MMKMLLAAEIKEHFFEDEAVFVCFSLRKSQEKQ